MTVSISEIETLWLRRALTVIALPIAFFVLVPVVFLGDVGAFMLQVLALVFDLAKGTKDNWRRRRFQIHL